MIRMIFVATVVVSSLSPLLAQTTSASLAVSGSRPVEKALEELNSRHGLAISYEDPRYSFSGDAQDVTLEVRRDLYKYPPGQAPKVVIPMKGALTVSYDVNSATGNPANPSVVVQKILNEYAALNGTVFQLRTMGNGRLTVVPAQVRDSTGHLVQQTPLLDTLVTLPAHDRRGYDLLKELATTLSQGTRKTVHVGTVPLNALALYHTSQGFNNAPARSVLLALLEGLESRQTHKPLHWEVLSAPNSDDFVINIGGSVVYK